MNPIRDERGVVAVVVAIVVCLVLIPLGALAVDLGVQRVARTDMQSVADVVALDTARGLTGGQLSSYPADYKSNAPITSAGGTPAWQSLQRNRGSIGDAAKVIVQLGSVNPAKYGQSGYFTPMTVATDVPTSVRILASTDVKFGLANGLPNGGISQGGAVRSAVSTAQSSACFQLGSYAASITPANSPLFQGLLAPLLGNSTLQLVGYNGLASASINLLDLVRDDHIGVGTVSGLLSADNLTAGDFYLAAADVLRNQGQIAAANVFAAAAVSVVAPMSVNVADMFGLTTASDAALSTQINALDLLLGTAFLADGNNLVGIPNLQAGLSSVGVTNTVLSIIEGPKVACGTDEARTAQIKLTSDAKLSLNIPLLNTAATVLRLIDPSTGQPSGNINLNLNVDLAGAHGHLTSTTCTPDDFKADIWTELANASLTGSAHLEGSVSVSLLGLAAVAVPVKLDIAISSQIANPAATTAQSAEMKIPPSAYGDHISVGSRGPVLPQVSVSITPGSLQVGNVTVTVLGVPVTVPTATVLSTVTSALAPVISALGSATGAIGVLIDPLINKVNSQVLGPLLSGLGINVPGADFYPRPTPSCNLPKLVG